MRKRKTLLGLGITCACMMIPAVCVCAKENDTTIVYGSGDYTRINPAMDEHGEINVLLFDGLTAHDGDNQVVPETCQQSWDYDAQAEYLHTLSHLREGRHSGTTANRLQPRT